MIKSAFEIWNSREIRNYEYTKNLTVNQLVEKKLIDDRIYLSYVERNFKEFEFLYPYASQDVRAQVLELFRDLKLDTH